jgi:hypothetical protein
MPIDEEWQTHQAIVALYPKFGAKRLLFRKPDRTTAVPPDLCVGGRFESPRDEIVNALVNRAAAVKETIAILAAGERGDDAMVLARVLLELGISVAWMLSGNWPERVDLYGASIEAFRGDLADSAAAHFPPDAPIVARAAAWSASAGQQVANAVFRSDRIDWARDPKGKSIGTRGMLIELLEATKKGKKGKHTTAFQDFILADASAFVHTMPRSILHIVGDLRSTAQTFDVRPAASGEDHARGALFRSNVGMLMVLENFDRWLGAGLEFDIQAIAQRFGEPAT